MRATVLLDMLSLTLQRCIFHSLRLLQQIIQLVVHNLPLLRCHSQDEDILQHISMAARIRLLIEHLEVHLLLGIELHLPLSPSRTLLLNETLRDLFQKDGSACQIHLQRDYDHL